MPVHVLRRGGRVRRVGRVTEVSAGHSAAAGRFRIPWRRDGLNIYVGPPVLNDEIGIPGLGAEFRRPEQSKIADPLG